MENAIVELRIPTPILNTINKSMSNLLKKNLTELTGEVNKAIEIGVETESNAADAESIYQQANKATKVINEVRLAYTRPIDEGKKRLTDEVKNLLRPIADSKTILDNMLLERKRKINEAKAKAEAEVREKQRLADEAAAKEQTRRENISKGLGGDGKVEPVVAEKIQAPITLTGIRDTTRSRSIPDLEKIQKAVDDGVREIAGINIYCVWKFNIDDSKKIPEEYKRISR